MFRSRGPPIEIPRSPRPGRRREGGAAEVFWPPSEGCVGLDARRDGQGLDRLPRRLPPHPRPSRTVSPTVQRPFPTLP